MAIKQFALALGLAAAAPAAHAVVLDFDTQGGCSGGPGVTFTLGSNIADCWIGTDWTGPDYALGLMADEELIEQSQGAPINLIVEAVFDGPVSAVSVDLGDMYYEDEFVYDADRVFLEVFGETGNLLGRTFFQRAAETNVFNTLSLTVSGIFSAKFGTDAGDFGFIAVDNFTYTPTPIPLPASLPLLLAGVGGLALLRRRARG